MKSGQAKAKPLKKRLFIPINSEKTPPPPKQTDRACAIHSKRILSYFKEMSNHGQ
jgi:hypothetical protein